MMDTETEKTPLQQKLDEFSHQLSKVIMIARGAEKYDRWGTEEEWQ